jgi:hypothetical protein
MDIMNETTGHVLLKRDVQMLIDAATRINKRMRSTATTFLAMCVSLSTVVIAIANLTATKQGNFDLAEFYRANATFLGIIGCFLYLIGAMHLISFCRDRKHYVRIISALNDLRKRNCDCLNIQGLYASLWTGSVVATWPPDSATTLTLVALSLSTMLVLLGSLMAFGLGWQAFVPILVSCFIVQTMAASLVSE